MVSISLSGNFATSGKRGNWWTDFWTRINKIFIGNGNAVGGIKMKLQKTNYLIQILQITNSLIFDIKKSLYR